MPNRHWRMLNTILGIGSRAITQPPSTIIVGLGNPGTNYTWTRHNVGFWCLDRIAAKHNLTFSRRHRSVLISEGVIDGHSVVLAKPRTFMNSSGQSVDYLLTRYRISSENLLIICDDINLPLGKIRLRPDGGSGGHNGLNSIIASLSTQEFPRLRVGVGRPSATDAQIDYVLGTISREEWKTMDEAIEHVTKSVPSLLSDGLARAMNRLN